MPRVALTDFQTLDWDPMRLVVGKGGRDPSKTAQALAEGFCRLNRPILRQYDITADVVIVRSTPRIRFVTNGIIGAFPLRSPITGQCELAGIIEPWIEWCGVGPMLSAMGMRVVPELVRLPMLPCSAREIPGWVIGSVVVKRLEALLNDLTRKYAFKKELLRTPRGRIDWKEYATKQLSRLDVPRLPCEFPALEANGTLLSVIHWALRYLQGELQAQRRLGPVVTTLLTKIDELLARVMSYAPIKPSNQMLQQCFYTSLNIPVLAEGLESVRWCAENRGLGGLDDLNGLAWRMDMPGLFEAYVETIVSRSLRYVGGRIRVDRLNETRIPICWHSNRCGLMRSLKPDIVVLRKNHVVIVDAKFKRYGLLQRRLSRAEMEKQEQEAQRHDIHQVIAYSACFAENPITACLVYPTSDDDYRNKLQQGQLHQFGKINSNGRTINLIMTYVPLKGNIDDVARELSSCICQKCE